MLNLDVYIAGQKMDLFEDETIQLVDSIQNLREPDKAISAFTKQFSVPASKENNKIFRHFYNGDISNGFDARVRVDAELKINGFDFRKGQVKLNGCKKVNGKADSYQIVFYGATSKIKEELSDLKLSSLTNLSQYNHDYTFSNIKDGFELGLGLSGGSMVRATGLDKEVVYPFISHTKQYIYDSTASPPIYNIDDPTEALDHSQLKPAIRFNEIMEAIESSVGISFDYTGFMSTDDFLGLYMWLHKDKGGLIGVNDNTTYFYSPDFTLTSGVDLRFSGGWFAAQDGPRTYDFSFTIAGAGNWDLVIDGGNGIAYEEKGLSGNQNIQVTYNNYFFPKVKVVSAGTITSVDVEMTETLSNASTNVFDIASVAPNDFVDIAANMPDMKVIDFLSSMFKMFNLILEKRTDDTYYVETMDSYYGAGNTIDITDMVDPSEEDVYPSRPYDKLEFKFEEAESYLMEKRFELLGDRFGDDTYGLGNLFENNDYEIKVGFEKILFERMEDIGSTSNNNLWAWAADDDTNPYIGKPIVFFYDTSLTSTDIEWENDGSSSTFYARCSNTVTEGNSATWYTLGFKPEIDEYDLVTNVSSLFGEYWSSYIEGIYDIDSRILNINAVLTPGFLLNYSLADTIVYRNKEYLINEIDVNLATGEATLELITKWL